MRSMRKMIWIALTSTALFAGACKKKDDSAKEMDRAASSAAKAQEDMSDQAKDVRSEQKDVNKDQQELAKDQRKDQQAMAKDQNDVAKQQGELDSARTDLVQARERFEVAAKQRLAKLDDKIHEVEANTDANARSAATSLRARRDELASKIDSMSAQSKADWKAFKKDVDDRFDKLESDAQNALK